MAPNMKSMKKKMEIPKYLEIRQHQVTHESKKKLNGENLNIEY
jgi:hypothetical protein